MGGLGEGGVERRREGSHERPWAAAKKKTMVDLGGGRLAKKGPPLLAHL